MNLRLIAISALLAAPAAQPQSSRPADRIARAIEHAGGIAALRGIRTIRLTGTEVHYAMGQEYWPWSPSSISTTSVTEIFDHVADAQSRVRMPPGLPPGAVIPAVIVNGDRVGMFVRDSIRRGAGASLGAVARDLRRSARETPERALLEASALDAGKLRDLGTAERGGERLVGVQATMGDEALELWFATADGALVEIRRHEDDPLFADRITSSRFSQWKSVGAVRLPHQVLVTANGRRVREASYSRIEVNPTLPAGYFDVPKEYLAPRLEREVVTVADVGAGVWRLEGGEGLAGYGGGVPYYSIVVQQGDSLILYEAPINAERSAVIADTLRARFPGKRLTTVIVSHGHFDHNGGVGAMLERGVAAIAPMELVDFVAGLKTRPSVGTRKRRVTPVGDSLLVGAGPTRFALYRVANQHAGGLLVAYFPETGLLVESDLQGAATPEDKRDLAAFLKARALRVTRIVGTHGDIVDWATFEKGLAK